MKALICSIFFLLLLSLKQMEARKSPEDYWKNVMGDGPIPEAIASLLESQDPALRRNGGDSSSLNWDRLINRDFDTRSMAIIYHHHLHHHHDDSVPHGHQVDHHGDNHAS